MNFVNIRNISTSGFRQGLSDPFKSNNSKANEEIKKKLLKTSDTDQFIRENKDHILARFVKKIFKPRTLTERFSKEFNIDNSYRIIYMVKAEYGYIYIYYLTLMLIPLWGLFVVIFLNQQLGEHSETLPPQQKVDNPLLYLAGQTAWVLMALVVAKQAVSSFILRIYYNQIQDKYKYVQLSRWFGFRSEEFTRNEIKYIFPKPNQNLLIQNLSKARGNVYINDKIKRIEFEDFTSLAYVKKMLGERVASEAKLFKNK